MFRMKSFWPLVRGWWAMILGLVQEKSQTMEKMNLDALPVSFNSLDTRGAGNRRVVAKPIRPIYYSYVVQYYLSISPQTSWQNSWNYFQKIQAIRTWRLSSSGNWYVLEELPSPPLASPAMRSQPCTQLSGQDQVSNSMNPHDHSLRR